MDNKYAKDIYDNFGGEQTFGSYDDYTDLIQSDELYRKDVYDNFGGEQTFGSYQDYTDLLKKNDGGGASASEALSTYQGGDVGVTTIGIGNPALEEGIELGTGKYQDLEVPEQFKLSSTRATETVPAVVQPQEQRTRQDDIIDRSPSLKKLFAPYKEEDAEYVVEQPRVTYKNGKQVKIGGKYFINDEVGIVDGDMVRTEDFDVDDFNAVKEQDWAELLVTGNPEAIDYVSKLMDMGGKEAGGGLAAIADPTGAGFISAAARGAATQKFNDAAERAFQISSTAATEIGNELPILRTKKAEVLSDAKDKVLAARINLNQALSNGQITSEVHARAIKEIEDFYDNINNSEFSTEIDRIENVYLSLAATNAEYDQKVSGQSNAVKGLVNATLEGLNEVVMGSAGFLRAGANVTEELINMASIGMGGGELFDPEARVMGGTSGSAMEAADIRLSEALGFQTQNEQRFLESIDSEIFKTMYEAGTGLARSLPAMATPFGVGIFAQTYGSSYKDAIEKGLSENEATVYGVANGLVVAALERYGFKNVIASKTIVGELASKSIRQITKAKGNLMKALDEAINKEVKAFLPTAAKRIGAGFVTEAETGGLQAIAESGMKAATNLLKDREVFTKEDIDFNFSSIMKATLLEGIGGAYMGTMGLIAGRDRANWTGFSKAQIEMLRSSLKSGSALENQYLQYLNAQFQSGSLSAKDYSAKVKNYERARNAFDMVPEEYGSDDAARTAELLEAKMSLESRMKNLPEATRRRRQAQLDKVNQELESIDAKYETETVQEPEPEVDQVPESRGVQEAVELEQVVEEGADPVQQAQQEVETYVASVFSQERTKGVVDPVVDRMDKGEYIDDTDIDMAVDALMEEAQRIEENQDLSAETRKSLTDSLYGVAEKIDNYELRTKTEIVGATEAESAQRPRKATVPTAAEQFFEGAEGSFNGQQATFTTSKRGQIVLKQETNAEQLAALEQQKRDAQAKLDGEMARKKGENAATLRKRQRKIQAQIDALQGQPDVEVEETIVDIATLGDPQIEFDEDGAFSSITVTDMDGNTLTLTGDQGLDFAIRERMNQLGEVPEAVFNAEMEAERKVYYRKQRPQPQVQEEPVGEDIEFVQTTIDEALSALEAEGVVDAQVAPPQPPLTKTQPDAIQEQQAAQVPVGEEAQGGQEVQQTQEEAQEVTAEKVISDGNEMVRGEFDAVADQIVSELNPVEYGAIAAEAARLGIDALKLVVDYTKGAIKNVAAGVKAILDRVSTKIKNTIYIISIAASLSTMAISVSGVDAKGAAMTILENTPTEVVQTISNAGILGDYQYSFDRLATKAGHQVIQEEQVPLSILDDGIAAANESLNERVSEAASARKQELEKNTKSSFKNVNGNLVYMNQWPTEVGADFVPMSMKGNRTQGSMSGVKGVAHFLLDHDPNTGESHPNNQSMHRKNRESDGFVLVTRDNGDGTVRATYKRYSEVEAGDVVQSPLRQFKLSDIDWSKTKPAEGFKSAREVMLRDGVTNPYTGGNGTYLIFTTDKANYGAFSGGSVVFIFTDTNGNQYARDFSGSIEQIQAEGEKIAQEYGIPESDIVIGYHDVGSFSRKPAADSQGNLDTEQVDQMNTDPGMSQWTGGALVIPEDGTQRDTSTPFEATSLLPFLMALSVPKRRRVKQALEAIRDTARTREDIDREIDSIRELNQDEKNKLKELLTRDMSEEQEQRPEPTVAPDQPTGEEVSDAKAIGVSASDFRSLYKIYRDLYGFNRVKAFATAIVSDRMVGAMAQRANMAKEDMYALINFQKADKKMLEKLKGNDKLLYQIVGSNAQLSKEVKDNLAYAEQLEREGADALKIKINTGWEKGKDDKWRYEIADSLPLEFTGDFEVDETIAENLRDLVNGVELTLEDIFGLDSELLQAYPEMANYKINVRPLGKGANAQFNPETNTITLDTSNTLAIDEMLEEYDLSGGELGRTETSVRLNQTLVHEVQHAVQFIEGFAKGANLSIAEDWYAAKSVALEGLIAENIEVIRENEEYSREFGEDKMRSDINDGLREEIREARAELNFLRQVYADGKVVPSENDLRNIYYSAAGEVESRNVEDRLFWSDAKRRITPLRASEKVSRSMQQILWQGENGAMLAQDGEYTIFVMTNGNVSTPLHELAHIFEHYLTETEKGAVLRWAGHSEWNAETSEIFARGFEKFLATGESPSASLQKLFNKFKGWLTEIYNGIIGSDIDVELNEPMKEIFASMLDKNYTIRTKAAIAVRKIAPMLFGRNGDLVKPYEFKLMAKRFVEFVKKGKFRDGFNNTTLKILGDNIAAMRPVAAVQTWLMGTIGQLDTLLQGLDGTKSTFFMDNIYRPLARASEGMRVGKRAQLRLIDEMANKTNGVTKGFNQIKSMLGRSPVALTTIKSSKIGKNAKRGDRFTYDQLAFFYALSKNDTQRERLRKQGIGEDTIKEIEGLLGKDLTDFIDEVVLHLSTDYYESVNDVYKSLNGESLPYTDFYFPTVTVSSKEKPDPLKESEDIATRLKADWQSALKDRTNKEGEIDIDGNFSTILVSHFEQMEHYKNYAPTVDDINAILTTSAVDLWMNALGYRTMIREAILSELDPKSVIPKLPSITDKFFSRFTSFVLSLKVMQIPRQMTSFLTAFSQYEGNLAEFLADYTAVLASFPSWISRMREQSATFDERMKNNLSGEIYALSSGRPIYVKRSMSESKLRKAGRTFKAIINLPTTVGDALGVAGYMAAYRRDIRNGVPAKDAIQRFNNYDATQQPQTNLNRVPIQRMDKFGFNRVITPFSSSVFALLNHGYQGAEGLIESVMKGQKLNRSDFRKFFIGYLGASTLFQFVNSFAKIAFGDEDDREEAIRDMAIAMTGLTMLERLPIIGAGIASVVNWGEAAILGGDYDIFDRSTLNPLSEWTKLMGSASLKKDAEKIVKISAGLAAGVNLDPAIGVYNLVTDQLDGEYDSANVYDAIGLSKSYRPSGGKKSGGSKYDESKYNPDAVKPRGGELNPF